MKPHQIVILTGLPGSGKSTWAYDTMHEEPEIWKRINKDHLRLMIDNKSWSRKNEKTIIQARNALITCFMDLLHNIIIDDTNIEGRHIHDLTEHIQYHPNFPAYSLAVKNIDTPYEECVRRNALRPDETRVPDLSMKRMKAALDMKKQNGSIFV